MKTHKLQVSKIKSKINFRKMIFLKRKFEVVKKSVMSEDIFSSCESDLNYCTFVLVKGKKKGYMCMKEATASPLFGRIVPACAQHRSNYEQLFYAPASIAEEEQEQEENEDDVGDLEADGTTYFPPLEEKPKRKVRVGGVPFCLEDIPKAIERSKECTICLENGEETSPILLPCGHTMCFSCTVSYMKNKVNGKCPLCRQLFKKHEMRRL